MTLAVSIVSHGHAEQVRHLLELLAKTSDGAVARVWLTLNVEEPGLTPWLIAFEQRLAAVGLPFDLHVIRNSSPQGFGANHNQAFVQEGLQPHPAQWLCVMNPDISWQHSPFDSLLAAASAPDVACVFPVQLDALGQPQDYQRQLPSPFSLFRRRILGQRHTLTRVDWVCGAFMVVRASAWVRTGGFDSGYFMYCEDVDLCLRLQLDGGRLQEASGACVVHAAHRRSLVNWRHLGWHVRSLFRLWASPAYRRYISLGADHE